MVGMMSGKYGGLAGGTIRRLAKALLLLFVVCTHFEAADAVFFMGKLTWRRVDAMERKFQFRVDTVWARDNIGGGLGIKDIWRLDIQKQWAAAVSQGPGAMIPVPFARLRLGDESVTPADNSSILYMNVTLVDSASVHASLVFTHTYNSSGPENYQVSFEGCCRPSYLMNNPDTVFRLQATVSTQPGATMSPVVAMHPIVQLRGVEDKASSHQSITIPAALDDSIGAPLLFRMATKAEMGEGIDGDQLPYSHPEGVTLTSEGLLTVEAWLGRCSTSKRCLHHVALVVSFRNQTSAMEFLIEIVRPSSNSHAPTADFTAFLTTPETSAVHPAVVKCGTGEISLPSNSTYAVSDCFDVEEMASFTCDGYIGVCPPLAYAFVPPFDHPKYIRCDLPTCMHVYI
jgi:hypothetical protein